jgi:hemerythrin
MALLVWDEDLSVKVRQVDEQHKRLIGLINELDASMTAGDASEALGKIIDDLMIYARVHFREEEALMARFAFPGFVMHKKEHDEFVGQISKLSKSFLDGVPILPVAVIAFLKGWLYFHIQGTDKSYSSFLNAEGIS